MWPVNIKYPHAHSMILIETSASRNKNIGDIFRFVASKLGDEKSRLQISTQVHVTIHSNQITAGGDRNSKINNNYYANQD